MKLEKGMLYPLGISHSAILEFLIPGFYQLWRIVPISFKKK